MRRLFNRRHPTTLKKSNELHILGGAEVYVQIVGWGRTLIYKSSETVQPISPEQLVRKTRRETPPFNADDAAQKNIWPPPKELGPEDFES